MTISGYVYRAPFFNALVFDFPFSHMARGPVKSDPLSMVQGLSLEGETGRTEPCFPSGSGNTNIICFSDLFVLLLYFAFCAQPKITKTTEKKNTITDQDFDTSAPVLCSRQHPGGQAKAPQGGEC